MTKEIKTTYRYQYNGKEQQTAGSLSIPMLDYGARMYNSRIGRWSTMDPLAEKYYSTSPYAFCANNPINIVDPDGRMIADFHNRKGVYLGTDGIDDAKIYLMNDDFKPKLEYDNGMLSQNSITQLKNGSTEIGGLIIQRRIEEGSDYTISDFYTIGGNVLRGGQIKNIGGYTLEPAGPSTTTPNQDRRIPEGVYNIAPHSTAKYSDHFVLFNQNVSRTRGILYHAGTNGSNTEGCIMPGSTKSNGSIGKSRDKFHELKQFIKSIGTENVRTIIINELNAK